MVAGGDFQLALSAARVPRTLVARMHTGGGVWQTAGFTSPAPRPAGAPI